MLVFKPILVFDATQLERGDKYDTSVVHLLETLDAEHFLVQKKDGRWKIMTGTLSIQPDIVGEQVAEKPEKKKKGRVKHA